MLYLESSNNVEKNARDRIFDNFSFGKREKELLKWGK